MAYESVKNQIDAYIKANGVNLITGPVLNAVLTTMLDELGEGYAFQGVLNTTDTPSPAADIPQAWLASEGTYLGGSITVDEDELALIIHTSNGWSKETVYRGVQLSHDAIVSALGYTPADDADLAEKQDTIADLSAIRSGAALGSTSVQPVDIENMVEAEPIGSIIPPVNPSEFATKEEVSQLGQEFGQKKTYEVSVTQGTQFTAPFDVKFEKGTLLTFLLQDTTLIDTSLNIYLRNGNTSVSYTLFPGKELSIITETEITQIRFNRSAGAVLGTGTIYIEQTIVDKYASGESVRKLVKDTFSVDITTMPLTYVPFLVKSGDSFVITNKTNKTLLLYFRVRQSSTGQSLVSIDALSTGTFTAGSDFYYLYIYATGGDASVERSINIQKTTSLEYRIKNIDTAIQEETTARENADSALQSQQTKLSDFVFAGKQVCLKGMSSSNVKLNTPIVLSSEGDSIEISVNNELANDGAAYSFANSGLTANGNYAIQLGTSLLGVRSAAGAWLFKDASFTAGRDQIIKIEYTGGNVVTSLNDVVINTYGSQPVVQIDSFGNGGNGAYGYWKGTINYIKLNGQAFNIFTNAILNDADIVGGTTDPNGILQYDSVNDKFTFFGKYKDDKFFSFSIEHEINTSQNVLKNLWRVKSGYLQRYSGGSFSQGTQTLYDLENEWASSFRGFQGDGGFVGGYHGGELITDPGCFVKFLADGKEITPTMMANDLFLNCKEFKYIQYSGLHKVQTTGENPQIIEGQPIFAYHLKVTTLSKGRMHTLNIVRFVDEVTRTIYHSGLFCTAKGAATNIVLPAGVLETGLSGGNNYIDATYKLVGNVFSWNETTGISADMDSKFVEGIAESEMELPTGQFTMWNRSNDTKYYRRTLASVQVAAGEAIVTESSIEFKAN